MSPSPYGTKMGQSRFSFATVKLLQDKIRNTQFQIFSLNNNLRHTHTKEQLFGNSHTHYKTKLEFTKLGTYLEIHKTSQGARNIT